MPMITFDLSTEQKLKSQNYKKVTPIAIVKGNPHSEYYNKILYLDPDEKAHSTENHIKIPEDCYFSILPNAHPDKRNCYYIAGPSGAGKSYIAKQIAENYHKLYPNRKIFIVSHLDKDDTLDTMDFVHRLDLERLHEADPDINEPDFANTLWIWDDFESIPGDTGKFMLNLLEQILIMGRKHTTTKDGKNEQGGISCIVINHNLTNYRKTKIILLESDTLILYPQATSYHNLRYVLETQMGMDKEEIKNTRKMGRFILASKTYPQYILSAHECKLLHQDD